MSGYKRYDPLTEVAHVYLMRDANGVYKIGKATDLVHRRSCVQSERGIEVTLVSSMSTRNPLGVERELHNRFRAKKEHNKKDWFHLDTGDVAKVLSVFADVDKEPRADVIRRELESSLETLELSAALAHLAAEQGHILEHAKNAVEAAREALRSAITALSFDPDTISRHPRVSGGSVESEETR